jgi:protein-disulfide isomerase
MKLRMRMAVLGTAAVLFLSAQDWQTATSLPGVDLAGLKPAQVNRVLKLLRESGCSCGCAMKMAECRVKDPNCSYSRGLASAIIDAIKAGRSDKEALDAAGATRWAKGPRQSDRVLDDPVEINVAGAPVTGAQGAPITVVEFSDFQCPYCIKAVPELRALLAAYPKQVRLIFKQFPLERHSQAAAAAAAALAAHKQGKFWPLHDSLFAQQGHLSAEKITALAAAAGLDMARFQADVKSPEIQKAVERDRDEGEKVGVEGTPTIYINGQHYNGVIALDALKPVIDGELKKPAKAVANR